MTLRPIRTEDAPLDDLLKIVGEQLILLAQVIGRERFQEQQSRR